MKPIQMVDLKTQYHRIKQDIDQAILGCLEKGDYINGSYVQSLQRNLAAYLGVKHVIPCANGTDALQIAMMAVGLRPGDEVIVPTFTYVATAEVIGLLGLTPVMVDVDADTFNVTADLIRASITPRTKAIVPVHLFGQSCDMEGILALAREHNLYVIEDNAQAIGSVYTFADGSQQFTGTMGHIGCTSFYPSKNLGAFGDGGAIFTNDDQLAHQLRMIANHGQQRRYYHDCIGVNSRLDNMQAAILDIKLSHLDEYIAARQRAADFYDTALSDISAIKTPVRAAFTTHVFHQYTLLVPPTRRDELQQFLQSKGIPSMIYYPLPLYEQDAFKHITKTYIDTFPSTQLLCASVLSLPMHTELDDEQLNYISQALHEFFA